MNSYRVSLCDLYRRPRELPVHHGDQCLLAQVHHIHLAHNERVLDGSCGRRQYGCGGDEGKDDGSNDCCRGEAPALHSLELSLLRSAVHFYGRIFFERNV
uniref:Uncharacterized protein n=1 Tax=Arundo donax TaxID=35708 RepID=A0A0A9CT75_ARUDO